MRADISFKNYTDSDYEALCDYLIALNENDDRSFLMQVRSVSVFT